MSWNLEGMKVWGNYLGEFPVSGTVCLSRVAYGGGVVHSVMLDEAIEVYGSMRDRIILEHEYISKVSDNFA